MPFSVIILILYINLLKSYSNKKCLFLRNMEPLMKYRYTKSLVFTITSQKRKKIMFKAETRIFIFSSEYAIMKPKATLRLFSAFKF